ncbi:MAG TPA: ribonuclease P protein component [Candidatus Dojkabacteria bacterium]|nr:ribonuclease P protein component [Candidatus Dojkabacteria bacterium]
MLPKKYRLHSQYFNQVFNNGFKAKGKFGMLVGFNIKDVNQPSIGFVVSKKVGNAVFRHKATRRLRNVSVEYFKANKEIKGNYQYISFIFPESYEELKKEMFDQFDKVKKKI